MKGKLGRGTDVLLANTSVAESLALIRDTDVDVWWNAMVSALSIVLAIADFCTDY